MNHKLPLGNVVLGLTLSVLANLILPFHVLSHEEKLDSYGCHYDHEGKNYHCHEGAFKGGHFDSKIQMIRKLKLQFLDLGRPWPYDDIAEEDITSGNKEYH